MAPSLMLPKLPMTPFRVMALVAGVAAICLVFSALTTSGRSQKLGKVFEQLSKTYKRDINGRTMAEPSFWRNFDFKSEKIPSEVTDAAPRVKVTNSTINIMGSNTFYREAQPPEGVTSSGEVVVLLHGAAFQSKTWLDLNTINLLAAMGHHVIAIDLPGFGESQSVQSSDQADYLHTFMSTKKVSQSILVSPSMSGRFSIPFIMKYPQDLGGYVPVAPVGTNQIVKSAPKLRVASLETWWCSHKTRKHSKNARNVCEDTWRSVSVVRVTTLVKRTGTTHVCRDRRSNEGSRVETEFPRVDRSKVDDVEGRGSPVLNKEDEL